MERGTKIWIAVIAIIVLLIVGFFVYRYTGAVAGINDCYDTDGGKTYHLKGKVYDDQGRVSEDFCMGNDRVKEYFCSVTGRISYEEKLCDEGTCVEGACVR